MDFTNIVRLSNNLKFKAEKNAPELLAGIGISMFGAAIAYTIKGTMKAVVSIASAQDELEELDRIDEDDEESKKNVKIGMATEVASAYLPAAIFTATSVTCFMASHNIQHKRAIGLAAAYGALDAGFEQYRQRVIDKYGEDADRELKYGIVNKKVKTTEIDEETGKKVKKTEEVQTVDEVGPFGVYFKPEYFVKKTGKTIKNLNWQPNDMFNLTFLKAQCAWFNGKLDRGERVYLSEVLKALGIPEDDFPDSRMIGWLPKGQGGDGYIRFNAYNPEHSDDFVIDSDNNILLDFNTDGTIIYK